MRFTDVVHSSQPVPLERRGLPLVVLVAAIWPVWQWLAMRAVHDAGDAWALLSLATAAALCWRDRDALLLGHGPGRAPASIARWGVTILLMLIYVASYPFLPPLIRAVIAMSALAAACSSVWFGKRLTLWLWGLLLLSLPLIPSLNFYLGYPLRVIVGEATSMLLHMNGFAVARDGATLLWNGHQISIDAPCSGVKMLWTGLYLSCALAALQRLSGLRTVALASSALMIVIVANVLRASALFYVEVGIVRNMEPLHTLIGVVVFVFAAVAIAGAAASLRVAHAS